MKKTLTIMLAVMLTLALVFTLAACGGNKTATEAQTATTAATEAAPAATEAATEAAAQTSSISPDDTVFTHDGVSVVLNDEADPIIGALGDPVNTSSQLSCHGGEGDDKTYDYNGFSVGTYPKDGVDRILEVVISGEGIPTAKGIQVGDPLSKVTEAYGDGYRTVGMYYAYEAGEGKSLQFFIENDTVKEIDYYYDV